MGTTAGGMPYPEPTDPVAQGAAAIKALAEAVDSTPLGIVGYAQMIVNQTGITVAVELAGVAATFTTVAARRYKLTGYTPSAWSSVSTNAVALSIRNGGTQVGSSSIEPASASTLGNSITVTTIVTGLSGSVTLKLWGARSGTGTVTVAGNSGSPCYLLVEDIGVL